MSEINPKSSPEAEQKSAPGKSRKVTVIAVAAVIIILICCAVSFSAPKEESAGLTVGSSVSMGSFPGSAEEAEPIEWIFVGRKDGKNLLLSKYCLEARAYDSSEDAGQSWETSTLREYLNGEFFDTAFSDEEQAQIAESQLKNSFETENGSNATADKVFILSSEEIQEFIPEGKSKEILKSSPVSDPEGLCWWWLRTPGYIDTYVSVVKTNGVVYSRGDSVINELGGVRPAIWVESK